MRDYSYYLDKAKEQQGFKYDNQIDKALGFKGSMTTYLRKGEKSISQEKMLELAKLAGENPLIALIDHNILSSSGSVKKSYEKISKGLAKTVHMLSVAGLLTILPSVANAAEHVEILTTSGGSVALTALYIITF